ncbi:50S ribosomal protein L20 [Candidatus Purcelliella pentastirinorum]|uniref:Large ribosomal subunit protein bL20 n=1 Tax=Candidatus Purcelliella pentastirinorum TaxID=472834 RepID=A0AAX3N8Z3_9ENTR|nr:50S ribosomal protein L20 [Candidatus Purcelliella pentastirinorum]WDI78405.1 50S ribosomal protein L20 [Candidatus Purcelliella pentastirinorum]WDR80567.1 50S ribosomal protein L20 [Candidatus Purcelliella pentastirinorum]
MVRIKRGVVSHARHKKILSSAKGYYGSRSRVYRVAVQAVIKAGQYSYRDRKQRKRQFRRLWIVRINAFVRNYGINYSNFVCLMKKASISLNRKILADMAINDSKSFVLLIKKLI